MYAGNRPPALPPEHDPESSGLSALIPEKLKAIIPRLNWTLVFPGFLALFFLSWIIYNQRTTPLPLNLEQVDSAIASAMASATPPPPPAAQVYQAILPSLVYIQTNGADAARQLDGKDQVGVGSGVIINIEGAILTSLHVVQGAEKIEVFFADGREASAEIVAADAENDIAVLLPNAFPEVIIPAIMGNPAAAKVGDETFAVGNPLGLAGSLSAGVISGFDRSLPAAPNGQQLNGLIQFDAAVNPGNSGGPLLNRDGQVIGIVTALANPTEENFFIGIGFAVPINTASEAAGGPSY